MQSFDKFYKREKWTEEEEETLRNLHLQHPDWSYKRLAEFFPSRSVRQIREHFKIFLDERRKHTEWTQFEDRQLITLYKHFGNKYAEIAKCIDGRNNYDCRLRILYLKRHNII